MLLVCVIIYESAWHRLGIWGLLRGWMNACLLNRLLYLPIMPDHLHTALSLLDTQCYTCPHICCCHYKGRTCSNLMLQSQRPLGHLVQSGACGIRGRNNLEGEQLSQGKTETLFKVIPLFGAPGWLGQLSTQLLILALAEISASWD